MRSSTGAYYVSLDHLRALAALLVFEWHFIHGANGQPVPYEFVPTIFPAAIFDEGHCGVALFMCLSGYLFAKLLDGKRINYFGFLWNRFIRLAPLLLLVIAFLGFRDYPDLVFTYIKKNIVRGLVYPTLPNGGWSITAEMHFYVVLPLILLLLRRNIGYVALIVLAAILLRTGVYWYHGEVQSLSYWTIAGRIDQFILGIIAFSLKDHMRGRHFVMIALFLSFGAFYWYFDRIGGFYQAPSYPSPYPIWIVLPTVEALFFSSLIAYYDSTFRFRDDGPSGLIAKIGTYSYSIYLTHFFYVFWMASIFVSLTQTNNFYLSLAGGLVCFLASAVLASITYHLVELPFLKLRLRYVVDDAATASGARKEATIT